MANAKKCDRCGKFYTRMHTGAIEVNVDNHPYPPNRLDLCDECTDELYKFLGYVKQGKGEGRWQKL